MDRRTFLLAGGVSLAAFAAATQPSQRRVFRLNNDWLYVVARPVDMARQFEGEGCGVGAVWLRAHQGHGLIRLSARHPYLGTKTVEIQVTPAEPEEV